MGVNDLIIYIITTFACIGAIDLCLGNRFGYGERFKAGFMAMGPLALVIIGIVSLSPAIAAILIPVILPVYSLIGADPASFANTILAIDMGGYALAEEMADTEEAALFAWVFLGTMMGPTIVFTIPVALSLIEKKDHPYLAKGILLGLITIPIGCFTGGLIAGFRPELMFINLVPTMLFSGAIALGLWLIPRLMIVGFSWFGKAVEILAIAGLGAVIVKTLTGITLVPDMAPLEEGVQIVGMIAIFLAGAFPLVAFIAKSGKYILGRFGKSLSINDTSTAGLIASLAHNIPMLTELKNMDARGKVINVAFAVSGAFVFGAHLGFVAGLEPDLAFPMIVGKLTGGLTAVLLAIFATSPDKSTVSSG